MAEKKLVLAILQGNDYDNVIGTLNQSGYFVTMLNSTGGFLKKRSVTVMIGVEEQQLDDVMEILKKEAGKRRETVYQSVTMPHSGPVSTLPTYPVQVNCGGVTAFVLNLEQVEKF